jgi:hypothetical protein
MCLTPPPAVIDLALSPNAPSSFISHPLVLVSISKTWEGGFKKPLENGSWWNFDKLTTPQYVTSFPYKLDLTQHQDCTWCISIIPYSFRRPSHKSRTRSAKFAHLYSTTKKGRCTRGVSFCIRPIIYPTSVCLTGVRAGRDFRNFRVSIRPSPKHHATFSSSSCAFPHPSATSPSYSKVGSFANLHLPPIQSDTPRNFGAKLNQKVDCTSNHLLCSGCLHPIRVAQYCIGR